MAGGFHLAAAKDAQYQPVMLIGHSREPNAGLAGNTIPAALRDISPGEELTTGYALLDDHDATMQCRRGKPGLAAARLTAQVCQA